MFVTKGRLFLCAFCFCARAVFLFAKLISERRLSTLLGGQPLLIWHDLTFAMFSSSVTPEEFVVRRLGASLLTILEMYLLASSIVDCMLGDYLLQWESLISPWLMCSCCLDPERPLWGGASEIQFYICLISFCFFWCCLSLIQPPQVHQEMYLQQQTHPSLSSLSGSLQTQLNRMGR